MSEAIVVVNAGSTSLKFGAYAVDSSQLQLTKSIRRSAE